jgi:hypothetical protein
MRTDRPMSLHPRGERMTVSHACPQCPIGQATPFCEVCLGTGLVSTERLARWQSVQNRLIAGLSTA